MSARINRRTTIALLGGTAAAWPLPVRAQQRAMPVIGFLHSESLEANRERIAAFRRGLAEVGYVEGRNVAIEYRSADGQNDRLPALAADLVRRQVAAIAAPGSLQAILAAKAATTTIPIIFGIGLDPVELGLVASLNRPGGNLTGVARLLAEMDAKRLQMLHELVPAAVTVALLVNPTNPVVTATETKEVEAAARILGISLLVVNATIPSEIGGAFAAIGQQGARALVVGNDALFTSHNEQVVALAARHAVPAIYVYRDFPLAGGLMSYGPSLSDSFRQVGVYTGRILKGEKPADLPVEQATKFELIINLKTAKALGLTFPTGLLVRADEVIE